MDRKWGRCFFFATANKEIDTVFKSIRRQFPDVFESGGKPRTTTTGSSFITEVRNGIDGRERLKLAVLKFLPATYQINCLTLHDFFFFASEAKKAQIQQSQKMKR